MKIHSLFTLWFVGLFVWLIITACSLLTKTTDPNGQVTYSPAAGVTNTVNTLERLNEATKTINPFAGVVSIVLASVSSVLGYVAKKATNKANQHKAMLNSVIAGIERATMDGSDTTFIKKRIEDIARANGVFTALENHTKTLHALK